jgi:hypothetical protein
MQRDSKVDRGANGLPPRWSATGRNRPRTDDGRAGLNRQQLGSASGLHGGENVAERIASLTAALKFGFLSARTYR